MRAPSSGPLCGPRRVHLRPVVHLLHLSRPAHKACTAPCAAGGADTVMQIVEEVQLAQQTAQCRTHAFANSLFSMPDPWCAAWLLGCIPLQASTNSDSSLGAGADIDR